MSSPVSFEALCSEVSATSGKLSDIDVIVCPDVLTLSELGVTGIDDSWKRIEAEAGQINETFGLLMRQWAPGLYDFHTRKVANPEYRDRHGRFPARARPIKVADLAIHDAKDRKVVEVVPSYLGINYYDLRFRAGGGEEAKPRQLGSISLITDLVKPEPIRLDNSKTPSRKAIQGRQFEAKFGDLQRFESIAAALVNIVRQNA